MRVFIRVSSFSMVAGIALKPYGMQYSKAFGEAQDGKTQRAERGRVPPARPPLWIDLIGMPFS